MVAIIICHTKRYHTKDLEYSTRLALKPWSWSSVFLILLWKSCLILVELVSRLHQGLIRPWLHLWDGWIWWWWWCNYSHMTIWRMSLAVGTSHDQIKLLACYYSQKFIIAHDAIPGKGEGGGVQIVCTTLQIVCITSHETSHTVYLFFRQ